MIVFIFYRSFPWRLFRGT